ncbi:DUF5605 domain-containing protein [Arthrobacter burdickii]|uniref:DUF5605 domain-containing protein n=1 Tax=Arthrobacter burdickii TaxID=3035920 RepID=A0ABT8JXH5_9MICC|nr:DUF5605 domain-containing protein [Arthrobacter burdickii]MDN4609876.1 DUF5605 domain-containing protein [Arthrobacter burdickii]
MFEDGQVRPVHEEPIAPRADYQPTTVPRASAIVVTPQEAQVYRTAQLELRGPSIGNPFVDVELTVTFESPEHSITVGGFYAGDGRYLVRLLPPASGNWRFSTSSNARSLDGITGGFDVATSQMPGPVQVADTFHFARADGTPFLPYGTTAYAWIHQSQELQDATIDALAQAPFTKIRMCLFPKDFMHNTEEPERYVFERDETGAFDTTRFDLAFFDNLERRLHQLADLGIEADLILFHPYDDRWGLSRLSGAADERYIRYVVRRLAGFPNVWWSMANEYDLLAKQREDWDRLAETVRREDHVGHPLSIHNWVQLFDYSAAWASHASLQRGDHGIGAKIDQWHRQWNKPVIIDEFGYEGDLDQGWGNLMAQEVVRRFWEGMLRGGYLTHGETYYDDNDLIHWSKGGQLHGESPARIAFLRDIVAASPTGRLNPLTSTFDDIRGGVDGEYILIYFGASRPRYRTVVVPEGMSARIDVIDTWDMSIEAVPGVHTGSVKVDLPAKPYVVIRLQRAADE